MKPKQIKLQGKALQVLNLSFGRFNQEEIAKLMGLDKRTISYHFKGIRQALPYFNQRSYIKKGTYVYLMRHREEKLKKEIDRLRLLVGSDYNKYTFNNKSTGGNG